MRNILLRKYINAKVILGILLCLFACYHATTITWYYKYSGFNYSGVFLILFFIFLGVLNIKQIDQEAYLKKHKFLVSVMMVTIIVIFLYSFINAMNKKEPPTLEEMYKIERAYHK